MRKQGLAMFANKFVKGFAVSSSVSCY